MPWTDESGNGNHLSATGSVGYTLGKFMYAADFDSASAAQLTCTSADFDFGGTYSSEVDLAGWSLWYNGTKQSADTTILTLGGVMALRHGGTGGSYPGQLILLVVAAGTNNWFYSGSGNTLTDGSTYHIVLNLNTKYSGGLWTVEVRLRVNDVEWISNVITDSPYNIVVPSGTTFQISQTTASRQLDGWVDDLIFKVDDKFEAAEVTALYNSGTGSSGETEYSPGYSGIAGYWSLDFVEQYTYELTQDIAPSNEASASYDIRASLTQGIALDLEMTRKVITEYEYTLSQGIALYQLATGQYDIRASLTQNIAPRFNLKTTELITGYEYLRPYHADCYATRGTESYDALLSLTTLYDDFTYSDDSLDDIAAYDNNTVLVASGYLYTCGHMFKLRRARYALANIAKITMYFDFREQSAPLNFWVFNNTLSRFESLYTWSPSAYGDTFGGIALSINSDFSSYFNASNDMYIMVTSVGMGASIRIDRFYTKITYAPPRYEYVLSQGIGFEVSIAAAAATTFWTLNEEAENGIWTDIAIPSSSFWTLNTPASGDIWSP